MRRNRFDANAPELVKALKLMGVTIAEVQPANKEAIGCSDAMAGYRGRTHGLEIKVLGGKLSASQVRWMNGWSGCAHVATSSQQAFELIVECHNRGRR